jgi:hypothetical protein
MANGRKTIVLLTGHASPSWQNQKLGGNADAT